MNQGCSNDQQQVSSSSKANSRLVTFVDTPANYVPSKDIFVEYRQKRKLTSHADDWVGVFQRDWLTLDECLTKQPVPKPTRRNKRITQKAIKIPANTIQVDTDGHKEYQMVYVTRDRRIVGMSEYFTIRDQPNTDQCEGDLGPFEMVEQAEQKAHKGTCMLDSFFVVDEMKNQILDAVSTENDQLTSEQSNAKADHVTDHKPVKGDDVTLISELIVTCEPPEPVPQVFLPSDFTVTPSGTTMLNTTDFIIEMEPGIQQYLQNPERSLLPVYPEQKAVLLYEPFNPFQAPVITCAQDPSKENSILEALSNLLSDAPTPPNTHVVTTANDSKRTLPTGCGTCNRRAKDVKISKIKLKRARQDRNKLHEEIGQLKNHIADEEILLDEFAAQIKNLVHDKAQLTVINENFSQEVEKLTNQMQRQRTRVAEMKKTFKFQKNENQELESNIMVLESQRSSYELVIRMTDTERVIQEQRNDFLESEIAEMKTRYKASEALLDDVMYTLSVQGYSQMVDINGNMIDLTARHGSLMELHGWSMEASKRDELHMINLAKQKEQIQNLKSDLATSQTEVQLKSTQVDDLRKQSQHQVQKNRQLIEKVEHLMYCMALAEEKEGALYNMLIQERQKHSLYQLEQKTQAQKQENKMVQTQMTYTGQKNASSGTNGCVIPADSYKSSVTFTVPQDDKAFTDSKKQKVCNADIWLPKRYSDAVVDASAKSVRNDATCNNDFKKAWDRQQQKKNLPVTQSDPPITAVNQTLPKVEQKQLKQQNVWVTESVQPQLENCGAKPVDTKSTFSNGNVPPTIYREAIYELSGQESSIFEGNVLKNLFRKTSSQVAAKQDSSSLQRNVIQNHSKDTEPKRDIVGQDSSIFEGDVLTKLFAEEKSDEHLTSPASSILEGDTLPNLFHQSNSEDSIETLDYCEPDTYLNQARAAYHQALICNEHTQPISLEEFTHMLDSALSILFQQAHISKEEPPAVLHPNVISALESLSSVQSEEEATPLLKEFSMAGMFANVDSKTDYDELPGEAGPSAARDEPEQEVQTMVLPTNTAGQEEPERVENQDEDTASTVTKNEALVSTVSHTSTRSSRGHKKSRSYATMSNSQRRKNRKNYKRSSNGATQKYCKM